ncbi:hypothetical protein KSP40_PGU010662 [Platanthera guangdongensis]|uniref:Uncharacterized protein n=1 Tax=Platanthera guangdongensis TaxID=2320717 RepID=A0ABR2MRR9_9ASPA
MNGIKENIKSLMAMEVGGLLYRETLPNLSLRFTTLQVLRRRWRFPPGFTVLPFMCLIQNQGIEELISNVVGAFQSIKVGQMLEGLIDVSCLRLKFIQSKATKSPFEANACNDDGICDDFCGLEKPQKSAVLSESSGLQQAMTLMLAGKPTPHHPTEVAFLPPILVGSCEKLFKVRNLTSFIGISMSTRWMRSSPKKAVQVLDITPHSLSLTSSSVLTSRNSEDVRGASAQRQNRANALPLGCRWSGIFRGRPSFPHWEMSSRWVKPSPAPPPMHGELCMSPGIVCAELESGSARAVTVLLFAAVGVVFYRQFYGSQSDKPPSHMLTSSISSLPPDDDLSFSMFFPNRRLSSTSFFKADTSLVIPWPVSSPTPLSK